MKQEKSCGCIVFNPHKQVLLVRMRQGHWSFPKGHVEEGESEEQTAIREVYEETHIYCSVIHGFREISTYSPYPDVMKDVVFFVALAQNDDVMAQEEEVSLAEFYDVGVAMDLITYENDLDIFRKAVEFLD